MRAKYEPAPGFIDCRLNLELELEIPVLQAQKLCSSKAFLQVIVMFERDA